MNKKVIFGVGIFITVGLLTYAFASPSTQLEEQKETPKSSETQKDTPKSEQKSETQNDGTLEITPKVDNNTNNVVNSQVSGANTTPNTNVTDDSAKKIEEAKKNAKEELENLVSEFEINSNYNEDINKLISEVKDNIDNKTTEEEIVNLVNESKDKLEEIKKDSLTGPVIELKGESQITLEAGTEYVDLGATAIDNKDGEVEVKLVNTLDNKKLGSQMLKYSAVDSDGNETTIEREVKVEDTLAPVFKNKNTAHSTTPIKIEVEDASELTLKVVNYDAKKTFTINNGDELTEEATYNVKATDIAGNTSNIWLAIDKTLPTINVEDKKVYNKDVELEVYDKFLLSGSLSINGNKIDKKDIKTTNGTEQGTYKTTLTEDGTYVIIASDKVGNTITKTITIDKTAPVIDNFTNSSNGEWTNSKVVTKWDIKETGTGLNIVQYSYTSDFKKYNTMSKSEWYGMTRSEERNNTVYVRAIDNAGNISNIIPVVFKIDKIAPKITVKPESLGSDGYYQNVSFSLYDNVGIKESIINGVVYPKTVNKWSDDNSITIGNRSGVAGKNTIVLKDVAGNEATYEFYLDKTSPKLNPVSYDKYILVDSMDTYTQPDVKAIDTLSGEASVKKTGCDVNTHKVGNYKCHYVSTDKAGNSASQATFIHVVDVKLYNFMTVEQQGFVGLNPDAYIYNVKASNFESVVVDVYSNDTKIVSTTSTTSLKNAITKGVIAWNENEMELTTSVNFKLDSDEWKTTILTDSLEDLKPTKLVYTLKLKNGDEVSVESTDFDESRISWEDLLNNNIISGQKIDYNITLDYAIDTHDNEATSLDGIEWGYTINGKNLTAKKIKNLKFDFYDETGTLVLVANGSNV